MRTRALALSLRVASVHLAFQKSTWLYQDTQAVAICDRITFELFAGCCNGSQRRLAADVCDTQWLDIDRRFV